MNASGAPWRTLAQWPVAFALAALRLLTLLPLRWQQRLGAGAGRCLGCLARRRRYIVEVNLRLCFPELGEAERGRLLNQHFAALGAGVLETASAWWAPLTRLQRHFEIEGLAHLVAAAAGGRGVLLLTGHFTPLEIGARALAEHVPYHAMHRPHRNPLYQRTMIRLREHRSGRPALDRDDIRGVLRALRGGGVVWYAPDQNMGRRKDSVDAPFFGIPARTITATSRLARAGDAAVVPYFPRRLPDGRYRVTVLPPLEDFPSDDPLADAARVNALIEAAVRAAPEQYLWVHRRFRPRDGRTLSPYRRAGK